MTTVGQCDNNVHDQTNNTNEATTDGYTNVFVEWRTTVTATGKTVVAVVERALAAQERGVDVGGVASCGAVAIFAVVGQINLIGFVQIVLAHQGGVFSTQTSPGKNTTFKSSVVVVALCPSEFGLDPAPIDVANAGGSNGASSARPIVGVGGGVVEVMEFVAIGWFFVAQVLARTLSFCTVVVPLWTRFARGTWKCILILKGTFGALLAGGAVFVTELSFAAGLAFGGCVCTGCASRAIFTQFIGCRAASFCSSFACHKSGWSGGINFRSWWYDDRGRSSYRDY